MPTPKVVPRSASTLDALAFPSAVTLIGDAIRDLVWLSDGTGAPAQQNRASRRYTGLDVEDLQDTGWSVLCHPEDRAQFTRTWAAAMDARAPFQLAFRCRRRDGAYRWLQCHASEVVLSEDAPRYWMATLTDVHKHRVLESELNRSVRQRDEFLATLVHEVRSPLHALRQALSVARTRPGSDIDQMLAQMHDIMDRQLTVLSRIADDSLDLSRVRWDAMSLVPSSITLKSLVNDATAGVRPVIEEGGVQLSVSIDEPDCEMIADAERLTQALTNLLGNAAKFGKPGGRVALRVACADGHAVFEVRDWGRGIEAARLAEIFELFKRVHTSDATRKQDGLGIGLAVAQHVAQLHGGSIKAHSDGLGQGSLFTMRVPLAAPSRQ